jgi:hypothetical protein
LVNTEEFLNSQAHEHFQKDELISNQAQLFFQKEELIQNKIENIKNELMQQLDNDRKEWENLKQQFLNWSENDDPNQDIIQLRILFLHHLSLHHSFQKEKEEIDFLFQTKLDEVLQNEDFETFLD